MQRTARILGSLALAALMAGCACVKGAKRCPAPTASTSSSDTAALRQELHELSSRVGNLEVNLNGIESSQREIQNELRTLTGLQEGLRQQLDGSTKQPSGQPDEK